MKKVIQSGHWIRREDQSNKSPCDNSLVFDGETVKQHTLGTVLTSARLHLGGPPSIALFSQLSVTTLEGEKNANTRDLGLDRNKEQVYLRTRYGKKSLTYHKTQHATHGVHRPQRERVTAGVYGTAGRHNLAHVRKLCQLQRLHNVKRRISGLL